MEPVSRSPRPLTRWIGVGAVLVVAAGLAVAARHRRQPAPSPVPRPGPRAVVDTSGDPVPRALAQATAADDKTRWVDDLPEVDLASLAPARRELFLRIVNTRRCTCGCGYTLAACRTYDATCAKSLPRVRAVFDSVAAGSISQAAGLRERPSRLER